MIKIALIERRAGKKKQKIKIMTEQQIGEIKRKADAGDAEAQYMLGLMHLKGVDLSKNEEKAKEMFRKAAAQEHPGARYELGLMYYEGKVLNRDVDKAWQLWDSASRGGCVDAMFRLSKMCADGECCSEFPKSAYIWALIAKKRGHTEAGELVENLESALNINKEERRLRQKVAERMDKEIRQWEKPEIDQPYKSTNPNLLPQNNK